VTIDPPVTIFNRTFFFGHQQPETFIGMRWGLDTSSLATGWSYMRAPNCGVNQFARVTFLGYMGNWCMSITIDKPTPIELTTWGVVKGMHK
jgi:hypothetical protein